MLTAVYVQLFLVLCCVNRFPSAVRRRIGSFSWETVALLCALLFRTFLEVEDLCEELGRICVVAQDAPVRRSVEFQRILRCFPINHKQSVMMVLHVEVATRSETHTANFSAVFVPNLPDTSPSQILSLVTL